MDKGNLISLSASGISVSLEFHTLGYRCRFSSTGFFPCGQEDLEAFLDRLDIPTQFQRFAARKDGIKAQPGEWAATKDYLLPQLRALIGRYSKLGDNAFYKLYLPVDTMMQAAIATD